MKADRKTMIYGGVLVVLAVVLIYLAVSLAAANSRLERMSSIVNELASDRQNLTIISENIRIMKKKVADGKGANFVTEVNKIASELSMTKSLKKIDFISGKKEGAFNLNDYDIRLEGIDLNTAVNFMYRLSGGSFLIKVKRCSMSVSFDNPNAVNITLLVSHVT